MPGKKSVIPSNYKEYLVAILKVVPNSCFVTVQASNFAFFFFKKIKSNASIGQSEHQQFFLIPWTNKYYVAIVQQISCVYSE